MEKKEFYKLLKNPVLMTTATLQGLQSLSEQYPCFHAAHILMLKNMWVTGNPDFEQTLNKYAITIPDRKRLYLYLHSGRESLAGDYYFEQAVAGKHTLPADDESEIHGSDLIDKFLSKEPRSLKIEKDKAEVETGQKEIIERSLTETDELITETLAMIYFDQKKYDKALDAFKKLSLKYPEKSIYFASRIEEIEKLKRL